MNIDGNKLQASSITIVDLFRALHTHRYLIVISVMVMTIGSVVLAYTLPVTYRSEALLAPAESLMQKNTGMGGLSSFNALRSLAGGAPSSDTAEALAVLKSRRFLEQFIVRHNFLPVLFSEDYDADRKTWLSEVQPTLEDGYLKFSRKTLRISVDDQTNFVRVIAIWSTRDTAQLFVNALVEDLNIEMSERAIRQAESDLDFLREQIAVVTVPEIRTGLANLIRDRLERIMMATNRDNYAFKVIDPGAQSKYRYQPRRVLIVAGGLILGFLLGISLIAIIETLRRIPRQR